MYVEKERGNLQNESIWICNHAYPAYHNWQVIQAHLHKLFLFAFLRYNWSSTLHYNELQINENEIFLIKQYKTVINNITVLYCLIIKTSFAFISSSLKCKVLAQLYEIFLIKQYKTVINNITVLYCLIIKTSFAFISSSLKCKVLAQLYRKKANRNILCKCAWITCQLW